MSHAWLSTSSSYKVVRINLVLIVNNTVHPDVQSAREFNILRVRN